ncbi:MAG: hypothetical protein ACOCVR_01495, partial [Myxococcota bacterium]
MNERALMMLAEESVRLAWMGALFLCAAALPSAVRAMRKMELRAVLPWLGAGVLALVLRLLVEPSLVHENRHGEMMYHKLLYSGHYLHGAAWFETMRGLLALRPGIETVFTAGSLLGALACVLAGLFAVVVLGARPAEGLLAAFLLAVLPVHVKVSASESPMVLAAFLTATSATALAHGLTSGRRSLIWVALLLAAVL